MSGPRIIDCAICGGDGRVYSLDGHDSIQCPVCNGTSVEEIEDEPLALDDFNDCFGTDMGAALEADAVKLSQLTGEEHVVIFLEDEEPTP